MTSVSAAMLGIGGALIEQAVAWSTTDKNANITLSNSNRDAACTAGSFSAVRADRGNNSGKRYFEISMPTVPSSAFSGFVDAGFGLSNYLGSAAQSACMQATSGAQSQNGFTAGSTPAGGSGSNGDYYMFAIDFGTGKCWVGKNNSWLASGNPAAGTTPWLTAIPGAMWPACSLYNNGSYRLHTRASEFQGTVPSGFSSWALGPFSNSGFAMVGDSITHLYGTTDDWRTLSGFGTVMEYGVPSNTTTQILARFANVLAAKPRAVFLLAGVNDVATAIPTATSQSNVASMISQCQAQSIPIIVQAILPLGSGYAGGASNAGINTLNTALQSTVAGAGAGATWVDWRSSIVDPTDYQADKIHLSHSGNLNWVSAMSSYFALYG